MTYRICTCLLLLVSVTLSAAPAHPYPAVTVDHAMIRVRGVNGNGRVIVAGTETVPGSQDACTYEMSFTPEPRTRIRWPEAAVYVVAGVVVALALVRRRQ